MNIPAWLAALGAWLMQPENLTLVAGLVLGGLGAALGGLTATGAVRRRRIALAAHHAYNIVEEVVAEMRKSGKPAAGLNKALLGLKYADEWMLANGWRELKPHEQDVARLQFRSQHGEEKSRAHLGALATPGWPS